MKTKMFIMLIALLGFWFAARTQQNNYSAKTIKLIPETNFLPQADWENLFFDASQSDDVQRFGVMNEFVVGPQEQIIVCNRGKYMLSILDKAGRTVKTFGRQGYKNGEFVNNPNLRGILNNKLIVVSDAQGRINFFDLDGNFVHLITLDFLPRDIFPLKSGKLIVWGHVPVSGNRSKDVIAELQYPSGKYKIIYERIKSNDIPSVITIPRGKGLISFAAPYSMPQSMVRVNADDQIFLADKQSNTITVFTSENGKYRESSFSVNENRIKIDSQDKQEFYQNFKEKLQRNNLDTSYAEKVLADGFYPEYLPGFYNLVMDAQNNVLFFVYTKQQGKDYAFQAYSAEGKFLGQSEFKIEGYDLLSNTNQFRFRNGYIYTLALKHGQDHPLRIIKCVAR